MAKHISTKFDNFISESITAVSDILYHGTSKGQARSIQNDGFMRTNKTGEEKASVSFTDDIKYAKTYAMLKGSKENIIILRIKKDDRFKLSPRIRNNNGIEYITFDKIPSSELEVQSKDGNWHNLNDWNVIFDEPLN